MIDTLIVAVVLCVDTCGQSPLQARMQRCFRDVDIIGGIIGSVLTRQDRDRKAGKPYWHLKNTYILRPEELQEKVVIGVDPSKMGN